MGDRLYIILPSAQAEKRLEGASPAIWVAWFLNQENPDLGCSSNSLMCCVTLGK